MLMLLDYWSHFDSKNKERGKEEKEGRHKSTNIKNETGAVTTDHEDVER